MLKKFITRDLIFIALISSLIFVVAISIGALIVSVSATPMAGGLLTGFIMSYLFAIAVLVIRKFGTGILIATIVSAMSIPTINMGPPGAYKVIIGFSIGFVIDIVLLIGKYKKISYYFAIPLAYMVSLPINLIIIKWLGLPGFEKIMAFLPLAMGIYLIEALIGTWLAVITYNKKLKHTRLIKQMQD